MKILVAAVGLIHKGPESELCADYCQRLSRTWEVAVKGFEVKKNIQGSARITQETHMLYQAVRACGWVCALDKDGQSMSSQQFASLMNKKAIQGIGSIGFMIGGADGFDQEFLSQNAIDKLSMGMMTWPHRLARVMLLEQLYRVQHILSNGPYHR